MKRSKLIYLLPALAFIACSKDSVDDQDSAATTAENIEIGESITEVANPENPGAVSEVYFAGDKIPVEQFDGDYIFQGDIMLAPDMVTASPVKHIFEKGEIPSQKSVARTSGRWPNNTVYYTIDGRLSNSQRVSDAIKHWEAKTNLKFVRRSSEPNYIYFTTGSGCSSYIGMIGGKQNLYLGSACSTGNAIHEIGHAVGLWHEQSRADRNSYITINYNNIESGREQSFYTYKEQGMDGVELTNALDFESIMLYDSYAFSKNGKPTMVKKNGRTYSAQRSSLSSGDKVGINKIYPYSTGGESIVDPVYENGTYYILNGLRVYRNFDRWYYLTRIGWREIKIYKSFWFYV